MNSQVRGLAVGVVDLVGHDQHGRVDPAQQVGDPAVLLGDADDGVDDEQDGVGVA